MRTCTRDRHLLRVAIGVALICCFGASNAAAQLPEAGALLAGLGLSPDEVAQVQAGQLVRWTVPPASDRELTAGIAFEIPASPAKLVADAKQDLLFRVDPSMIGYAVVAPPGSPADFAKLTLAPDAAKRAAQYVSAQPGGDLNLSAEEIAAFQKLGSGAAPAAVEAQVRSALLARLQAYATKGLAGIAPYAHADGKTRSPADELRTATNAAKKLEQFAPSAFRLLQSYPSGKPPGTEEIFRWSQFDAHGVPTIALTHTMIVPDGDAYLLMQRQFYVSTGYNAEQAVVAFLPSKGGTVLVYGNRTSTDQITGFGGGTKRSLGSKMLASQLESIFEKARARAK
jgi:hypothetical protein